MKRLSPLVREVAPVLELSLEETNRIYRIMVQVMKDALLKGEEIRIQGLGSFKIKHRKAHRIRVRYCRLPAPHNKVPSGGTGIHIIPAHNTVVFEPALELKRMVNTPETQS